MDLLTAYKLGFLFRLGMEYVINPRIAQMIKPDWSTIAKDADFKEGDHPRDKDGKFKSGSSSSKYIEDVYGHEITGLRLAGQKAVDAVLKRKGGHVKDAFYRKGIGYIDIIWGDKNRGLCHAIASRKKHGQSADEVLSMLGETIKKGNVIYHDTSNDKRKDQTYTIEYSRRGSNRKYRVIITKSAYPAKDKHNKLQFVLTDMLVTDNKNKGSLITV